jgi:hypothetical protein
LKHLKLFVERSVEGHVPKGEEHHHRAKNCDTDDTENCCGCGGGIIKVEGLGTFMQRDFTEKWDQWWGNPKLTKYLYNTVFILLDICVIYWLVKLFISAFFSGESAAE